MSDTPDLFKIRSAIYNTYHTDNVKVFYNKDGAWQIPGEVCGQVIECRWSPITS